MSKNAENTENVKVESKVVDVEATEVTEVAEVKENKLLDGIKKHGKKIAVGAAALIGGAVLFALGRKSGRNDDCEVYTFDDDDVIDVDSNDVD